MLNEGVVEARWLQLDPAFDTCCRAERIIGWLKGDTNRARLCSRRWDAEPLGERLGTRTFVLPLEVVSFGRRKLGSLCNKGI